MTLIPQQSKRISPWLVFLAVFAVYAYTAYPTVAPRDSADLAVAALTVSPAHPPGYPLYALLGRTWLNLLPWGDPAYRLNLMSAAAGAGCATTVFLLLSRSCAMLPALAAVLALALSAPLWKFSLLCEMYSLQGLFLALLLLLAPGPEQQDVSQTRRFFLSALFLGLALVNHQAFILATPGLAVLWWGPGRIRLSRPALALFLLGWALYFFLWVRLGDLGRAWAVLTRREYGTWQLSAGFSRPLSVVLALRLIGYPIAELWRRTSPSAAGAAVLGLKELWRRDRRFVVGLLLILLGFGPGFFLAARFDLSGWVARTVMESALVAPAVVVCLCAGYGLDWCGHRFKGWGPILAAAVAVGSFWQNGGMASHRDDFSAYDYVKDLRRALPPDSTVAVGGDTALYASRYLDLAHPDGYSRRLVDYQDASPSVVPGCVLGISLKNLARLGLGPEKLFPAGLVQGTTPMSAGNAAWEFSILRRGQALRRQESYARDILFSYAFAHYISGVLREARRDRGAQGEYVMAAALDPEDYHIQYNSAGAQ